MRWRRHVVNNGEGQVSHVEFMEHPARNYQELLAANHALYSEFALVLPDEGVLVLPEGRWYRSIVHSDQDIAGPWPRLSQR